MRQFSSRIDLLSVVPVHSVCAELGVQAGHHAAMIDYLIQPAELVLVDAWRHFPGPYERDASNVTDLQHEALYRFVAERFVGPRYEIIRRTIHDAAELFPDHYFDFVYVDGCHLLEAVRQDLADWWPKVRPGGLFAGHDYGNVDHPAIAVRSAVDEFCASRGLALDFLTTEHCGSWGIVKKG